MRVGFGSGVLAALVLLGFPLAADALAIGQAKGGAPTRPEPLEELIADALAHNPDLAAARLEAASMRARVGHVRTWPEPELGGGFALMEMGGGLPQPTMPDLTLSQAIPDPARLDLMVQEAGHIADASYADVKVLANRIARQVTDAYADAAYADGALGENQAARALTRELVQVATGRYASGQGTMGDVLRAQAELSRLVDAQNALEQRRSAALATLGALLGRPAPVPDVAPLSPVKTSGADWPDRVASASPEIAAARDEAAAMESRLALTRREREAPSYKAQVGVGLWNPGNQPYVSGMLTVNLPWLAPVRYHHLVHHATEHAAAARAKVEATSNELRAEAIIQSSALARDQKQAVLYEQGVIPQLEAAYRSSLAAYQVGRADFADVIAEERDLYRARLSVQDALAGQVKARSALEALAGDFGTGADAVSERMTDMGGTDGQHQ